MVSVPIFSCGRSREFVEDDFQGVNGRFKEKGTWENCGKKKRFDIELVATCCHGQGRMVYVFFNYTLSYGAY